MKDLETMDEAARLRTRLIVDLRDAEEKAWDSLRRYKFQMFGYWAAIWVHLNRVGDFKKPNPFKSLVHNARQQETHHARTLRLMAEEDAREAALNNGALGVGA